MKLIKKPAAPPAPAGSLDEIAKIAGDLIHGGEPIGRRERPVTAGSEGFLKAAEHDPYVAEVFGSVTDLMQLLWR